MTEGLPDPSINETGITIPPPFVFLAAMLAGFLPFLAWPIGLGLSPFVRIPIAILMIAPAIFVLPAALKAFERAGTEFDVRKMPHRLITDGPFRYSRNPGYVAFALLFGGVAVAANNLWSLVFVALSVVFVHFKVVLAEEAVLEKRFGQDYLDYKRRVRRWV